MLIDTHAHLNDPMYENSLTEVVERAKQTSVVACVVPAYDRESLERTKTVCALHRGFLFPAYGIHPWYIDQFSAVEEIKKFIANDAVAIGEIGLDLSPECPAPQRQLEPFKKQLDMALELDLPVILHTRKANEEIYKILKGYNGKLRGVAHSFSGGPELAMKYVELGFYISFSGAVTRKRAKKYHKTAIEIPLERMLVETDVPSIATESTVASQVEPRHTVEVAQALCALRGIPFEELCKKTAENSITLFKLNI